MKFYKAQNAEVGEGVEASVLLHKDTGDELICIFEGAKTFEHQNPSAKECSKSDADKLLAKASLKIRVPSKKEVRKKSKKLKDDDIAAEISNEETLTSDVAKIEEIDPNGDEVQKLTYYEDMEIKTVDDFLAAREAQRTEVEEVEVEEEPTLERPAEEAIPVEEETPQ